MLQGLYDRKGCRVSHNFFYSLGRALLGFPDDALNRGVPIVIHEPLTVLLIEDNRDDEQLALRALRTCGLPLFVRVARDGEAALRALGLEGEPDERRYSVPDLVISDLKMPKVNGDEVLRRARGEERLREVPYVVFSSSDEEDDVRRCLECGATAYCVKPVDFQVFLRCATEIARHWLPSGGSAQKPFCILGPAVAA
ncbi:response regulator [bacterium]|nr:MAG: response regulator [bacterium]